MSALDRSVRIAIESSFNRGLAVPRFTDQISTLNIAKHIRDRVSYMRALYSLEKKSGIVGHLFYEQDESLIADAPRYRVDYTRPITPIQCEARQE